MVLRCSFLRNRAEESVEDLENVLTNDLLELFRNFYILIEL